MGPETVVFTELDGKEELGEDEEASEDDTIGYHNRNCSCDL